MYLHAKFCPKLINIVYFMSPLFTLLSRVVAELPLQR